MGKRSNFDRIPRDFYPTPLAAVEPLLPFIQDVETYAEPCAGDGALMKHLQANGLICMWASDIEPKHEKISKSDFKSVNSNHLFNSDVIITNPPWDRKLLHPMIEHFSALRPTWLLFDADWVHTKQSARFMPLLRKIVSVGRVKWIPDSKMTGKDNCAWHLFDVNGSGCEFHGRAA